MSTDPRPHKWRGIWRDDPSIRKALETLSKGIEDGIVGSREELQSLKLKVAKELRLKDLPTNSMLIDYIKEMKGEMDERILSLLRKKPTRTLSGVAVVAVMTSPHDCPHGKCKFCPGGTDNDTPTPQSYTGREPAAMRAAMNQYDPYKQAMNRIEQLEAIGHSTDKIDLILMGGTITAREPEYQTSFVKGCLDAMNGSMSVDIHEAQLLNETAGHRCIGMTFETRPDHFGIVECDRILELGGTRIELGAQSTFDGPLKMSGRGHGTKETIDATMIAKDSGLKVSYHLMPGLPGSSNEMDVESARIAFTDQRFMPDMIKIYPTLVIKGTDLYNSWKNGEYEPLDTSKAAEIVARIKRITPPWVRIQRVQRDIPTPLIESGVEMSNLRQVANSVMKERGWQCRCIRCREVGHRTRDGGEIPDPEDIEMRRTPYEASGGQELFISMEHPDTDTLLGYLRLRYPSSKAHRSEMAGSSIIREVKIFGQMAEIGKSGKNKWQHRGMGKELISEGERIASEEFDSKRILVMSGIGVREYYRNIGYRRLGPYMARVL